MAQNDNLLAAPASGFGQNISFATRPDGVPLLDGVGRDTADQSSIKGNPEGNSAMRYHEIEAPPPDPTFQFLMKVGESVAREGLKKEKAAAFVSGMQRAAAGEAIQDIANEQPWYTRIFGESDVIEGARQYTAQAKAAETASAVEEAMPNIRKLDANGANAYFTELVSKQLTGDDITDAALLQGFAKMLPGTMRRHAKEHYAWRQEEASTAESRALLAHAKVLQQRGGGDTATEDESVTDAINFISSMRPAAGRDKESWLTARTQDLMSLAQAGQFRAVNAMRAGGFLDLLNPDQRTKVENSIDAAENRLVANKSVEYAEELGRIAGESKVYSTDLDPAAQMQALQALNARFRRETGVDRDLVTLSKASGIIEDVHATILREGERRLREGKTAAEKAATAGDRAAAEEFNKITALGAIGLGIAGAASRADKMKGVVDEQFLRVFHAVSQKGPGSAAGLLFRNYTGAGTGDGYISADVRDMYERSLEVAIGAQMPAKFMELHEAYVAMRNLSPTLADRYFGKHADRMQVFHSILQGAGPDSTAMAFTYAFGSQEPPRPRPLTQELKKAATKSIEKQHDAPAWNIFGQQRVPLRPDQAAFASDDLQDTVAKYLSLPGQGSDIDTATMRAYAERRANGTDMLGGFYIKGRPGQEPLSVLLKRNKVNAAGTGDDYLDVFDGALQYKVEKLAEAAGVDASDPVHIERHEDVDGVAHMTVYYKAKDGSYMAAPVTSTELQTLAREQNVRKGVSKGLTLGSPIQPGDYDKGAAIVREQMRNRNK